MNHVVSSRLDEFHEHLKSLNEYRKFHYYRKFQYTSEIGEQIVDDLDMGGLMSNDCERGVTQSKLLHKFTCSVLEHTRWPYRASLIELFVTLLEDAQLLRHLKPQTVDEKRKGIASAHFSDEPTGIHRPVRSDADHQYKGGDRVQEDQLCRPHEFSDSEFSDGELYEFPGALKREHEINVARLKQEKFLSNYGFE